MYTMKVKYGLIILFLFPWFSVCQSQKETDKTFPGIQNLNLDFEVITPNMKPESWELKGKGYNGVSDQTVAYSGKSSFRLDCIDPDREIGGAALTLPKDSTWGKRLRYSGFIKTENVEDGFAGLFCQVRDENMKILGADNMWARGVIETTPWTQCVIELDIPPAAKNIRFGVTHTSTGKAWFDSLQLDLNSDTSSSVPTDQELEWIRTHAIPIKTTEPIDDQRDLLPLKELIGQRQIVALGEGTHGTREFFKMKHRITKFLAEEMGFTVFAIEANMPEAREVNRYVLTGEGDPQKALAGLYFWTWNTAEVLDMIKWMRQHNLSGKGRIEFYGFDMQYPPVAMKNVTDFVKKADNPFFETLTNRYQQIEEIRKIYKVTKKLEKADAEKWFEAAKTVYEHLNAHREIYLKSFAAMEVDWAIQDARVVLQSAGGPMIKRPSRDQCMADNLDWILAHQPKDTKVIIWAHNGHINRNIFDVKPMGHYLDERHKDNMMVFGFAFNEGNYTAWGDNGVNIYSTSKPEPGSLEWGLKASGIPDFILDIRGALKGEPGLQWLNRVLRFRIIGAFALDDGFFTILMPTQFDAVIFFDKSTPTACFNMGEGKKKLPASNTK